MPIYTYRCTECGVEFEQHQTFSDPPLTKCPECGKKSLRKVFTPAGIIFKGNGWYATDHRSPSGSVNIKKDKTEGSGGKAGLRILRAARLRQEIHGIEIRRLLRRIEEVIEHGVNTYYNNKFPIS